MMKNVLAIIIFGMTTSLNAETLSFPSFQIEVEEDWEHIAEPRPTGDWGSIISLYKTSGEGVLNIVSYAAPDIVSRDTLRNMTNLELSIPLTWQGWGDYSGYQYDYTESGAFYRQWWLINERTIIFITYKCDPESKDIEFAEVGEIVNSITVNNS